MHSVVPSCRRRGRATARACLLALLLNVLVAAVTARHVAAGGVVIPHWSVHQDRGLDCEAAATEAMLSTVGNPLTQDDIQSALPLDTRPAKRSHPGNVVQQWGNPWTQLVRSVGRDQDDV